MLLAPSSPSSSSPLQPQHTSFVDTPKPPYSTTQSPPFHLSSPPPSLSTHPHNPLKTLSLAPDRGAAEGGGVRSRGGGNIPSELFAEFVAYLMEQDQELRVKKILILIDISGRIKPTPVAAALSRVRVLSFLITPHRPPPHPDSFAEEPYS